MSENDVFQQQPLPQPQQNLNNGYQVPAELVTLPSKGLLYPLGHPLSNETAVEIKTLTAKEEDLLTSKALIKNGTVINQLLKSCILNKTIDPDEMLSRRYECCTDWNKNYRLWIRI